MVKVTAQTKEKIKHSNQNDLILQNDRKRGEESCCYMKNDRE
jgi:hypothetical protein